MIAGAVYQRGMYVTGPAPLAAGQRPALVRADE